MQAHGSTIALYVKVLWTPARGERWLRTIANSECMIRSTSSIKFWTFFFINDTREERNEVSVANSASDRSDLCRAASHWICIGQTKDSLCPKYLKCINRESILWRQTSAGLFHAPAKMLDLHGATEVRLSATGWCQADNYQRAYVEQKRYSLLITARKKVTRNRDDSYRPIAGLRYFVGSSATRLLMISQEIVYFRNILPTTTVEKEGFVETNKKI